MKMCFCSNLGSLFCDRLETWSLRYSWTSFSWSGWDPENTLRYRWFEYMDWTWWRAKVSFLKQMVTYPASFYCLILFPLVENTKNLFLCCLCLLIQVRLYRHYLLRIFTFYSLRLFYLPFLNSVFKDTALLRICYGDITWHLHITSYFYLRKWLWKLPCHGMPEAY